MRYAETPSIMASPFLCLFFVVLFCQISRVQCLDKCIAVCEECLPPPLTAECVGERLRRDGCDCCTVCAGQVHDYCDLASPCDEEFGLSCEQNICTGPFNVRVTSEGLGSLTIEWNPFLESTHYEYVLFFTTEYSHSVDDWFAREVGNTSRFVLEIVQEGVDHFIRIASMPIDGVPVEGSTFTEILVYRTSSLSSWCHFNSTHYSHGESILRGCETCTCHTGEWSCAAKTCPAPDDVTIINPVNCRNVPHPSEPECCQIFVCEEGSTDNPKQSCWHGLIEHRHGDIYNHGCNETCYCDDGNEFCMTRCEETGQMIPDPTTCPNPVLMPPPEGECCEMWVCLPPTGSCEFNGNVYEDGERFDVDCESSCRCHGGNVGCVSMCPPTQMLPTLECPSPKLVDIPGECCQQWQCGPPPNLSCELEGVEVHQGDWIDIDCKQRCHCQYGIFRCVPLCPTLAPLPDLPAVPLCPEPFIGKRNEDDCCVEFFCHHPDQVSPNEVQEVLSQSSGPSSVVISFFPPTNPELLAILDIYEVYYTSEVNVTDLSRWKLKRVQATTRTPLDSTRRRRNVDYNERRVVVEVTGLTSNTVYFIKIRVRILPTHYVILPEYLPFSDTIVIKTANSTGGPCQFRDQILADGEEIQDGCVQSCQCDLGVLVCKPLCQTYLIVPSQECPLPKLITVEGQCCKEWRCFANEGDCRRNNRTYLNGEEWREGCDQRCFCTDGAVTCQHLCLNTGNAPVGCPRAALVNVPDTCCQQWVCHPEIIPTPRPLPSVLPPRSLLSVNITVSDVTASMAVIRWPRLTDLQRRFITGLVVKHKDLIAASYWRRSERLHPTTTNFTLIGLDGGKTYLAQMVILIEQSALSIHLDSNIVTIHTKNTGSPSSMPFLMPVSITISLVTDNSMKVTWPSLPVDIVSHLRTLQVVYNDTKDNSLGKVHVGYDVNSVEIHNLKSQHKYSVVLLGIWGNGTVLREIKSNPATITTNPVTEVRQPTLTTSKSIIIGVCVVAAVVIATLAFAAYVYIQRRDKRQADYEIESAVAFENKIYDTEDGESHTGAQHGERYRISIKNT